MGTVLEMTPCRTLLAALAAALTLTGCGNDGTGGQIRQVGGLLKSLTQRGQSVDFRTLITPQLLAQLPAATYLVEIPDTGSQAFFIYAHDNGGNSVYFTPGNISMTLRRGVLVGTRGFGTDLMVADVADVVPAVHGGGGQAVVRIQRYLDGEDQITQRAFYCDYTSGPDVAVIATGHYPARRVDETCTGPDIVLTNSYWIDSAGKVRRFRQWLGPVNGYMTAELIKD